METHSLLRERLSVAGLRPTRQRLALAQLLFGAGDRHVSAERLFAEARAKRLSVSLATVYNTLNQFTAAGLLRAVALEGECAVYDTNTSNHCHYFDAATGALSDIDHDNLRITGLGPLPAGKEIDRIDVIVRLKDKD
jgi:Fur family transcriptional regulator, iron response regulator